MLIKKNRIRKFFVTDNERLKLYKHNLLKIIPVTVHDD